MRTHVAWILRLLLCFVLALNGLGAAVAGVHAHPAEIDQGQAHDLAASTEAAPGDRGGHCEPSGPATDHSDGAWGVDVAMTCCDGMDCDGPCPGVHAAAVPASGQCIGGVQDRCHAKAAARAHQPPPTSRPTRPPIG